MDLVFLEGAPPPPQTGRPPGQVDPPPPTLDMTDNGFSWTQAELDEAVRLMRDRLFESNPELDEDLPRRAHLRVRRMT